MTRSTPPYIRIPMKTNIFVFIIVQALSFIFFRSNPEIELVHLIVLLAVVVLVPIGLGLLDRAGALTHNYQIKALLQKFVAPSALLSIIAIAIPQGPLAGILEIPWLLTTGIIALSGLLYLKKEGFKNNVVLCFGIAQLYILVGGCWLVADRFDLNILNFSKAIIVLTGMHFHYTGFTTTLIAALVGNTLIENGTYSGLNKTLFLFVTLGVTVATPIIAIGITAVPLLEVSGAYFLVFCLLVMSVLILKTVKNYFQPTSKKLIIIAASSLFFTMFMTVLYANSEFTEANTIRIPLMIFTHGIVNSVGFALCGILAFHKNKAP